jgi:hypothetical protein
VKTGTPVQKIRALTLLTQQGPKPDTPLLIEAAGDADASVRQFAVLLLGDHPTPETAAVLTKLLGDASPVVARRVCEAFVRTGLEAPVEPIVNLLPSDDRWLAFAARLVLERIPAEKWKAKVLAHPNPRAVLLGLLALSRLGPEAIAPAEALAVLESMPVKYPQAHSSAIEWARMIELAILRGGPSVITPKLRELVLAAYRKAAPQHEPAFMNSVGVTPLGITGELARILAVAQVPEATPEFVALLHKNPSPQERMHYALCLRYLNVGWTNDLKRSYLDWYDKTGDLEGGNSLQGYLRNIVAGTLDQFTPAERKQFILAWKERPHAARVIISASQPDQVQDFEQVIAHLMADSERKGADSEKEMLGLTIDALSKSTAPASQALLRKLFDEYADRRDVLARGLAKQVTPENIPYLERAVASADKTTMQV